MQAFSIEQIAAYLQERFTVQCMGDHALMITHIAPLDRAGANEISFFSDAKRRQQLESSEAGALLINAAEYAQLVQAQSQKKRTYLLVDNPYACFAYLAQYFVRHRNPPLDAGLHPTAVIASSAKIAATARIDPMVVIEDDVVIGEYVHIAAACFIGKGARIGSESQLSPRVVIYAKCVLGDRVIIHSGAVIGADGFGFAKHQGQWIKIPQTGRVVIGNDVEVGANTTIDRGALDDTIIEEGVKLDNQIQIGHNCRIGAHTAMAGCVGVAGSTQIGRYCTFGGAAMVLGHLQIADHVHISAGSMVSRSIHEPGQYTGFYPLSKNAQWEKSAVIVRNLEQIRNRIKQLEKLTLKSSNANP